MITGQLIFVQYSALGSTPDPARLSAQVITGVGFLGAGTILREGATVKGLTTAASLWAVACLGIAAGGGYYSVAIAGMVFIFVTLTFFEFIQHKLVGSHSFEHSYCMEAADISAGLRLLNAQAQKHRASIRNLLAEKQSGGGYAIRFDAEFGGARSKKHQQQFFEALASADEVQSLHLQAQTAQTK